MRSFSWMIIKLHTEGKHNSGRHSHYPSTIPFRQFGLEYNGSDRTGSQTCDSMQNHRENRETCRVWAQMDSKLLPWWLHACHGARKPENLRPTLCNRIIVPSLNRIRQNAKDLWNRQRHVIDRKPRTMPKGSRKNNFPFWHAEWGQIWTSRLKKIRGISVDMSRVL